MILTLRRGITRVFFFQSVKNYTAVHFSARTRRKDGEKYGIWLTNDFLQEGIDLFFDHNPELKQFFAKDVGRTLQYHDSQIMDKILARLTKKGIPAIPIHDSVIVMNNCDVGMVEAVMGKAYQDVTKLTMCR